MDPSPCRALLGSVALGDGLPVALMGVLNVSPESFYPGSVHLGTDDLLRAAQEMVTAGASLLDVGAMSTAPYLETRIGEAEETDRLATAVARLTEKFAVVVSADTSRRGPARAALDAGATVINDVTGLRGDPALAALVAERGAGLLVMASPPPEWGAGALRHSPVETVAGLLEESLGLARQAGIAEERTVIDPGIGFFRSDRLAWHVWDVTILSGLGEFRRLRRPIAIGVSRKSFLGALTGRADPAARLAGSLAATAIAVRNGATLVRTHDVGATRDAILVASAMRP